MLLGLLVAEDETSPHVLAELGVTRAVILAHVLPGPDEPPSDECVGLMPRLKHALELALRLGERHESGHADSEHLLVAITQVPDALAIELLEAVGVCAGEVRTAVARRLGVDPETLLAGRRRRRRLRASNR